MPLEIVGLETLPEVRPGDDLAALLRDAALREQHPLNARTILVVAQKIVSKAEGAVVDLRSVDPSPAARDWAARWQKDPRLIELILRESRRIVKMERGIIIAETCHGFVTANAGVDQSNVGDPDSATILPRDPDASARRFHEALACGVVIVTDTFGRPWREGLVNVAIGISGMDPFEDYRGRPDRSGRPLESTILALADEIAAAAGLVMRKTAGVPAALIYGFDFTADPDASARALIRPHARDLFR